MHRFHGCGYGYGFGGPPEGLLPTPTAIPGSLIAPLPTATANLPIATSPAPGTPSGTLPSIPGMHSGVHHGMLCIPVSFSPCSKP